MPEPRVFISLESTMSPASTFRPARKIDAAVAVRHGQRMLTVSPLAPEQFPNLPPVPGVTCRVARARYKEWDRCDLTYIELTPGTTVAGVTTRNICCSTEVEICREGIARGQARALVVNAGNSNAFTGYRGREAVERIMQAAAAHLNCGTQDIFVSSTGVIGVPLPIDKAAAGLAAAFSAEPCGWQEAAETIRTTDTFAKGSAATAIVGGSTVHVVGIAKGSGMIAPDMATMLAYVFTDAAVSPAMLQQMLTAANHSTFNSITVDGDTSTSDTLLLFATGAADNTTLTSMDDPGADALAAAIHAVCKDLAQQIVRDGEGATKFIEIVVEGAMNEESARSVGLAIGNSPLVKTAIAGEDANWGRVVMAVGKAGQPADRAATQPERHHRRTQGSAHCAAARRQRAQAAGVSPLVARRCRRRRGRGRQPERPRGRRLPGRPTAAGCLALALQHRRPDVRPRLRLRSRRRPARRARTVGSAKLVGRSHHRPLQRTCVLAGCRLTEGVRGAANAHPATDTIATA